MAYKTILVHLNDERRVAGLIDAANSIAQRFEAHIIALYAIPPIPTYGPTAFGAGYVEAGLKSFRAEADRVRKAFEDASRNRAVVPEWRLLQPRERTVADCVIEEGRCADLIIVGQRDRDFDFSALLDAPERVVMESGRPVLVVPNSGRFSNIGDRVTVAWNGGREASRAAFDALPLLTQAKQVRIVSAKPKSAGRRGGDDLPGADLADALARHGVKCDVAPLDATDIGIADALLSGLSDDSSDLLVMGAWGHSRMRELVFGGVTRHILEHMTVPVLMSH